MQTHPSEMLIRIIQEGLTNAIRHGDATRVTLALNIQENKINLLITDNGRGCRDCTLGQGLSQMKEMIEGHKGSFSYGPQMSLALTCMWSCLLLNHYQSSYLLLYLAER